MYFPEPSTDFYRCSFYSNFAESNVPGEDVMLPTLNIGTAVVDGVPKKGVLVLAVVLL